MAFGYLAQIEVDQRKLVVSLAEPAIFLQRLPVHDAGFLQTLLLVILVATLKILLLEIIRIARLQEMSVNAVRASRYRMYRIKGKTFSIVLQLMRRGTYGY